MNRKIVIFSVFFMIAGAALGVSACKKARTVYTESGLCLEEHEEGYTVCGIGTYEGTQLAIPESFEEKPVTAIGEEAFSGCGQIERVTLPQGITRIGPNAFSDCTGLSEIEIPQSVTWIGPSAFSGCTGLSEIEIPDGVTLIGNHAFSESGLTNVSLPGSVTSLGDNAFKDCEKLIRAEIAGSVGEIRWNVFSGCTALSEVVLGEGIEEIGTRAFSSCTSLRAVGLPESVVSIGRYAFESCSSLENISIPKNVSYLGAFSFRNCTLLDTFSIPQKVNWIGEEAFSNTEFSNDPANWRNDTLCRDGCLIEVKNSFAGELTCEQGTRLVAEKAAYGCKTIASLTLPDGVLYLGKEAFAGCAGLTSLTLPDSLLKLGNSAFDGCEVKTATVPTFVLPSIAKTNLEKVVLTSGEEIGESAFAGAEKLVSAEISDSVTKIGASAFSGCGALKEIRLPEAINEIADSAFFSCVSLKNIALPDGVTEIGNAAFSGCRALEEILFPEALGRIGSSAFSSCVSLRSVEFPDGVTKIGDAAFSGCARITRAKIGSGVEEIGRGAFENCYRLIEVWNRSKLSFEAGEKGNGNICQYAKAIYSADESSKQTGAADGSLFYEDQDGSLLVDYYGSAAEFSLPNDSPSGKNYKIYPRAFYGRDDLEKITVGSGVEEIGREAFCNCTRLTDLEIGDGSISVGERAFYGCSRLTSVTFGSGVTEIGQEAFSDCLRLLQIELPDSVTEIGERAFYHCLNLTSVALGSGVEHIGEDAFENCYKLIEVCNRSALTVAEGGSENGKVAKSAKHVFSEAGESNRTVKDGFLFYEDEEAVLLLGYIGEEKEITLPKLSPSGKQYVIYRYAFAESSLRSMIVPTEIVEIGEGSFMNCKELRAVYYTGDVSRWKETDGRLNVPSAALYYFSETEPTPAQRKESEHWWHYNEENEATEWKKQLA